MPALHRRRRAPGTYALIVSALILLYALAAPLSLASAATAAPFVDVAPLTGSPITEAAPAAPSLGPTSPAISATPDISAASAISVVFRGPAERKWIALTFDDNTIPGPTLETLRVLQEYQVPATLFVCGYAVEAFPEVTEQILRGVANGLFEVGDHSGTHRDLTTLSSDDLYAEIGAGTDAFREATGGGRTVPLFRPPYGRNNSLVAQIASQRGFTHMVLWDVGTEDWTGEPAETIEKNIVSRAHNGAIMLLHMAAQHTAAALPGIVTRLRAAGYEFVSVSQMLRGARLFLDVDPDSEVGRAVATLTASGTMSGYNADYFGPLDHLTRRQAAKVVTLAAGIHTDVVENVDSRTFWDVSPTYDSRGNIQPYPYDFIEEAAAHGLLRGTVDEHSRQVFRPDAPITRVQLAQILARMCREIKGYTASLEGTPPSFTDVPDYAAEDVALVARLGLMKGYASNAFGSYEPARRGHVAVVVGRYLELPPQP